jgi:geranylgeranyl diphosphate synthase type II
MVPTHSAADNDILDADAARRSIDAALTRYVDFDEGCPSRLGDAIRHSLLAPGKRLRPLLVLWAAEACGSEPAGAMPAACAVEMVHTYSLIHDDLPAMDDDDLRRGRPSCHAAFGEATAILAGDALLARGLEIVATQIEPPELAARCCAELAHAAGATALVGGQADDLDSERAPGDLPLLESIHRRKTGAMLVVSVRLGALVAGADDPKLACLLAYGRNLGLAFQITDDLLDSAGDEKTLGKRAQKDPERGKLTFPGLLGVEESRRRARQLVAEARQAIVPLGSRAGKLDALAGYLLTRNR